MEKERVIEKYCKQSEKKEGKIEIPDDVYSLVDVITELNEELRHLAGVIMLKK